MPIKPLPLHLHIGISGFLTEELLPQLSTPITLLLHELYIRINDYNTASYGFDGSCPHLDFYTSPLLCNSSWMQIIPQPYMSLHLMKRSSDDSSKDEFVDAAKTVTVLDTAATQTGYHRSAFEWITSQADLAIVVWEGLQKDLEGMNWSLIHHCIHAQVPCICIDAQSPEQMYWMDKYSYEPFTSNRLRDYLHSLYSSYEDFSILPGRKIPGSALWTRRYSRFTQAAKKKIKDDLVPVCPDSILDPALADESSESANTKCLKAAFEAFDHESNALAQKSREAIYFRSILPLIATIFLSIGFYIETIFGILGNPGWLSFNLWTVLAGIGFLIHAFLNCYGFYMSKNQTVKQQKHFFLCGRYIAEFLRCSLRLTAYNIPVDESLYIKQKIQSNSSLKPACVYLHHLFRSLTAVDCHIDQNSCNQAYQSILELLDNQIAYHQNSQKRYHSITVHLSRLSVTAFWIAFVIVGLRGGIQFFLAVTGTHQWGSINGITVNSLIRTATNFCALFAPAMASHFSTKLSLNNFDGLEEHFRQMEQNLLVLKKKITGLAKDQPLSYELLQAIAEDVLTNQMNEVNEWYAQTSSRTVTKL